MDIKKVRDLMAIEKECVTRANTCNRDCANCELVQKDTDLLEAYSFVIDMLNDKIRDDGSYILIYEPITDTNFKLKDIEELYRKQCEISRKIIENGYIRLYEAFDILGVTYDRALDKYYDYGFCCRNLNEGCIFEHGLGTNNGGNILVGIFWNDDPEDLREKHLLW